MLHGYAASSYNEWFIPSLSELLPALTAPTVSSGVSTPGKCAVIKQCPRVLLVLYSNIESHRDCKTVSLCCNLFLSCRLISQTAPTQSLPARPANMSTTGDPLDLNETVGQFTKQTWTPVERKCFKIGFALMDHGVFYSMYRLKFQSFKFSSQQIDYIWFCDGSAN